MDARTLARSTRLFLLDMDGTVYLGRRWIPGAREFLDRITETGREYAFVTNNASRDTSEYLKKLSSMGLDVSPDRIVTSGHAAADYLINKLPEKRIFVLGTEPLKRELAARGVQICRDSTAEAAVVSFDTSLCYADLCTVCDLVRLGVPYIATHPDLNCPTETGFIPDCGANIAFIEASTGRRPDVVIGKPQPELLYCAMRRFGASAGESAMIGDRLYTDVASGLNAGIGSVLVLSGETTASAAAASDIEPTLILDSVAQLTEYL